MTNRGLAGECKGLTTFHSPEATDGPYCRRSGAEEQVRGQDAMFHRAGVYQAMSAGQTKRPLVHPTLARTQVHRCAQDDCQQHWPTMAISAAEHASCEGKAQWRKCWDRRQGLKCHGRRLMVGPGSGDPFSR